MSECSHNCSRRSPTPSLPKKNPRTHQCVKGYGQWNTCIRTTFNQQYPPCSLWSQQAPCTKAMATTTECKSNELLFSTAKIPSQLTSFHNAYSQKTFSSPKHTKQLGRSPARCIHLFMRNSITTELSFILQLKTHSNLMYCSQLMSWWCHIAHGYNYHITRCITTA
jgi:hypothetical protein